MKKNFKKNLKGANGMTEKKTKTMLIPDYRYGQEDVIKIVKKVIAYLKIYDEVDIRKDDNREIIKK